MERHQSDQFTFDERLEARKAELEHALKSTANPEERDQIECKLRQLDTARDISQWLTSPALTGPR